MYSILSLLGYDDNHIGNDQDRVPSRKGSGNGSKGRNEEVLKEQGEHQNNQTGNEPAMDEDDEGDISDDYDADIPITNLGATVSNSQSIASNLQVVAT